MLPKIQKNLSFDAKLQYDFFFGDGSPTDQADLLRPLGARQVAAEIAPSDYETAVIREIQTKSVVIDRCASSGLVWLFSLWLGLTQTT